MKYQKNSYLDTKLRSIAVKLGIIRGKQLVSVFSKSLTIDLDTPGISSAIYSENYREIDHTNIYSKKLSNKKNILDLGANIGYYMLQAATDSNKNSRILCVEPDPRNLELLDINIKNNYLEKKVSVIQGAIDGDDGKVSISVDGASNLNRIINNNNKNVSTLEVQSFCLNTIHKIYGEFDCLRMDVEGAESIILSKNSNFFLETMPPNSLIFMEVHPGNYIGGDKAIIESLNILNNSGFTNFEIVTSGKKQDKKVTERIGSSPNETFKDGKFRRNYYKRIPLDDVKYLITQKPKIIRYVIAEKG